MNTYTLFFPNKLRAQLIVEVFGDGTIYRCVKRDPVTLDWVGCGEGVLTDEMRETINADIATLRWEFQENSVDFLKKALKPDPVAS